MLPLQSMRNAVKVFLKSAQVLKSCQLAASPILIVIMTTNAL